MKHGGPLTLELHDTVFRNEDSIARTAMLVKSFFDLGIHQLQINSVSREKVPESDRPGVGSERLFCRAG